MNGIRNIIEIDEERCNGCGNCVADCAEGAIAIVNGKAKVVSDSFCDGLGACIGRCPTDALRIIQREAPAFDEAAAMAHVAAQKGIAPKQGGHASQPSPMPMHGGCPGMLAMGGAPWPVKIRLVSPDSPFLKGADLVIAADCAAPVTPQFQEYVKGKIVLIGCPKFEEGSFLAPKLLQIFRQAKPKSCTVLRMEVPCCGGLPHAVRAAHAECGLHFPLEEKILSRSGRDVTP